jgi:tetratricopeptide (TPR) repeat protein
MTRTINRRFALFLLTASVLLGLGLYGLYGVQLRRNAATLLRQADQAEAQGNLSRAGNFLSRYLTLQPDNHEVLARYGLMLDRQATSPADRVRTLSVLRQVFRLHPERADVGRRLAWLAAAEGRVAEAREVLDILTKYLPNDGELEELHGRCEEANGQAEQAAEWFTKAIGHCPTEIDSYVRLARLLRGPLHQPQQADQVMENLVAANTQSFRAYLARGRYRQEFGSLAEAATDVAQARTLAPYDAEVLLTAALIAQAQHHPDDARSLLRQALETHPQDAQLYMALASVEQEAGRGTEALANVRQGLQEVTESDQAPLLALLTDLLIQQGELTEAADVIERLRRAGASPVILAYQEARLRSQQGQWSQAVRLLEQVSALLAKMPDWALKVHLLRGLCYEQLGCPDQQLAANRDAVALNPVSARARRELGLTLLSLGRFDEAVEQLEAMMKLRGAPPSGWALLARALLAHNLSLPEGRRDWRRITAILDQAAQATPEAAEVAILKAEALAAQGQPERGRQWLEQARDQRPDQTELWITLAQWAERRGDVDAARKLLAEAQQRNGPGVELLLARLDLAAQCEGTAARANITQMETELGQLARADRPRLLRGLAEAYERIGASRDAERLWKQLATQQPQDFGIQLRLLDQALQAGQDDAVQHLTANWKELEGEEGTYWRYGQAARRVALAQRAGSADGLEEARRLLTEVAARRPEWPSVPLLQATIAELEGDANQALAGYQRALDLGDQRFSVIQRLVQRLYEQQRYTEADQVTRKLPRQGQLPGAIGRLAAQLAVYTQDTERALALARKAVQDEPQDYRNHLWLGLSLWAAGHRSEAAPALRQTIQLAETLPHPWVAFVRFLVATGQRDQAEAVFQEARRKLPPDRAALGLAHCCEALGYVDQAEQHYQAALEAKPDDLGILRSAAAFFLANGRSEKAKLCLRRLIDRPQAPRADVTWARRQLALVLAGEGHYRQFQEALALVERNLRDAKGMITDERVRARVLATQPSRRREAIAVLKEIIARQPMPKDRFLLAQLLGAQGQWPEAREQLISLLASDRENPVYLAHYARGLLRRGEIHEVAHWLTRLESVQPKAWPTVEIKARLLHAQGKTVEASTILETFAQAQGADIVSRAAALLDELGQAGAAERMYRQALARSKQPESILGFIRFLGRQNRLTQALDECDRAWQTCPPEAVASVSVALLAAAQATPELFQRVENRLQAAIRNHPQTTPLLFSLGQLRNIQGRYAEAMALYRQVIDRDPGHVAARNNLAWLLALHEHQEAEALALIHQAIDTGGPLGALLDTRAVIFLSLGQTGPAVRDLQEALAQAPTAVSHVHLAQAHWKAGNHTAARDALRKVQAAGLQVADLHPLERPAYSLLTDAMGSGK